MIEFNEKQAKAYEAISYRFEKNEIDYMPLNGIVLKSLYRYPESCFTRSIDFYIWTEQSKKVASVMKELGYTDSEQHGFYVSWNKDIVINVRLFTELAPGSNKLLSSYYKGVGRLIKKERNCRYSMSTEDTYIYMFINFADSFRRGCAGIRDFVNLYVYQYHYQIENSEYVKKELTKLDLYRFYLNICKLYGVWFNDIASDALTDYITAKLFDGGIYGEVSVAEYIRHSHKSLIKVKPNFRSFIFNDKKNAAKKSVECDTEVAALKFVELPIQDKS